MLYELKNLTQNDINIIATALANRPWGEVHGLMEKITAQVQQQEHDQPRQSEAAPEVSATTASGSGGGSGGPGPFRPKW